MSPPRLTEATVTLIKQCIQANLPSALVDVRNDRDDALVVLSQPDSGSYFVYEPTHTFKAPAIIIIAPDFDFKTSEKEANHISGVVQVKIAAVVEDRDKNQLTYKAWRYQSALHEILGETQLTSTDFKVKLTVVIKHASFSPEFSTAKDKGSAEAVFRKEVLFECSVYHWESF